MQTEATLDAAFAALADPTRRAILARLASGGDATVQELAQPFPVTLPAITKHLKVLEKAGLITRGRDAQRRPCALRPEPLADVTQWVDHTRQAWEGRFDRLEAFVRTLQAQTPAPKKEAGHE